MTTYVTPHGETRKKSLNPNPRYSQFSTNGVLYRPLGFFTDYSSRMFISQFPANKITEIDLEVCEKRNSEHYFAFFSFFKGVFRLSKSKLSNRMHDGYKFFTIEKLKSCPFI